MPVPTISTLPTLLMYKPYILYIVLLMYACTLSKSLQAKVYLVSVGISDYPGTKNDLSLPANDARTMAWLYSKNSAVEYTLLINGQATLRNINAAMNRQYAKATANDIVVLFFSGHGYPGGFVAYDGKMDYSMVRRAMARTSCRHKMIFADACFSGRIAGNRHNSANSVASAKNADVMLFLSSRRNETSIERRGMQNGFFTTALQRGLRGGADANNDRIITARELFTYVHNMVTQLSNNRQHPVMWGKFPDNLVVMRW